LPACVYNLLQKSYNLLQICFLGGVSMTALPEFDVVVVGAGAAGMTAALTAARHGLRALVVEKAPHFGGSTARSGGGVWIPGNSVLQAAGVVDTPEQAARYLAHIVGPHSDPRLQAAFLRHGPDMLELVETATPLKFRWVRGYSDYYPEAPGGQPGGRSVEPSPLPAGVLGDERDRLNPPYLASKGGLAITQADYKWLNLIARHPRGVSTAIRVGAQSWLNRARGREMLTMGQALAAGLRAGLARAGVPVWLSTPLIDLELDGDRVIGVRVSRDGEPVTIRADRGVVLAAGGFEQNAQMRKEYQRQPIGTDWTVGAAENTGDAILAGQRLGARLLLMDDAWWGPSVPLPSGPYFLLAERTLPGCILVNGAGRRFVNEAAPYVDAVHAMYDGNTPEVPHIPAWLVFDQSYRNRYLFAARPPRQGFPSRWYRSGAFVKADSLDGLAAAIGLPAEPLAATVKRFNAMAQRGRDDDFRRGESAYDRYYGDPRNRPNPCLAPLARSPFYAVQIVPGDLGTKGGLSTDERARVLRQDGSAIPGLYAAGNTSAPVMGRTYAGPGATLGPAMTFGYVAALDLALGTR
jgi:3-oxosteroid 1-dehydrogenase